MFIEVFIIGSIHGTGNARPSTAPDPDIIFIHDYLCFIIAETDNSLYIEVKYQTNPNLYSANSSLYRGCL